MGRRDADGLDVSHPKIRDPYTVYDFFNDLGNPAFNTRQPSSINFHDEDQKLVDGSVNPCSKEFGRIFRFDDGKFLLVQFMRPRVWRIRFNPGFAAHDYSDYNTRTIVQDDLTEMIGILNAAEGINWKVEFKTVGTTYYILQSILIKSDSSEEIIVQLWLQRNPFRITAVRSIASAGTSAKPPALQHPALESPESIPAAPGRSNAIIWQTKVRGLMYQDSATILNIDKPLTAKYLGFGEQGGKSLFKSNTFMNYFNFDNMRYFNIYDEGPQNDAEPLYHSEPYWIEVNAHPGYMSQVASFIDNYSQVVVDLGKTDASRTAVATRFNSFQGIFLAGDDIGQVIQLYSSIIGRPWLRPRYILGHHQGCYGYDKQELVEYYAEQYRKWNFPLDGMHIDVDMQRNYKTFTIDTRPGHFPDPKAMFSKLRALGVRCSTNITPVISCITEPDFEYETYNTGWLGSGNGQDRYNDHYFVRDRRDNDPSVNPANDERYIQYGKGTRYLRNPNTDRPEYGDTYDFSANRNSGWPFHGGVDYGGQKGSPGFYPNLNNREVRQWWGRQYQYLFDMGLEFVWQDMTSPCMSEHYGDMKSWPFRLLIDQDGWPDDTDHHPPMRAIEIWSLYSFNLHKATFKGLHLLDGRQEKRNFIIGRGSFAGAQRYAGLWTGDNSSTWEFFSISVAQVLALGLGGVAFSGADVGGFEPVGDWDRFADPELLIRWYGAYSLLPWFRNHYVRKGKKYFQEPFEYENYRLDPANHVPEEDKVIYQSVLPVCRYLIRLRYSLLQLLYDAMFENTINGLPIARAMVITDPLDSSLFSANDWYTAHQYLVRNDLLVAPVLYKQRPKRKLYLPHPDAWYPLNLRPDTDESSPGEALKPKARGGSYVEFDARIAYEDSQLPYVTPMYVREGAIIPQIEARQSVPDRTRPEIRSLAEEPANPITIHVYPGKDSKYNMYVDDGVSRSSAPTNDWLATQEAFVTESAGKMLQNAYGDTEAANAFREVVIKQTTVRIVDEASGNWHDVRRIEITTPLPPGFTTSGFSDDLMRREIGPEYRLAIWHAVDVDLSTVKISTEQCSTSYKPWTNPSTRVSLVRVPIEETVKAVVQISNAV
ncbi:glycosyl hydrolases family 31-domain-containing protein [Xylariomycetidae sp. FL2044]|nr:glycosyl hydrolases family 31-domain-containing protein [Xylariomycetidae sp. FL2044]